MLSTLKWNEKQRKLKDCICKMPRFEDARELYLALHAEVHFSAVSGAQAPTLMDELWKGLTAQDLSFMPSEKDLTIAWNLWHITRVEDMVVNLLIDRGSEVLTEVWMNRMKADIRDTGNAMTPEAVLRFSQGLDRLQLKRYRIAVGQRSREVLCNLRAEDMKRRVAAEDVAKIRESGGVVPHPDSEWLLDFWGRKDVAGLILMPVTRHQLTHLHECARIKQRILRSR